MSADYVVMHEERDGEHIEAVRVLAELLGLPVHRALVVEVGMADLQPALDAVITQRGLAHFVHYLTLSACPEVGQVIGQSIQQMQIDIDAGEKALAELDQAINGPAGNERVCEICGKVITPERKGMKICANPECAKKRQARYQKESYERKKSKSAGGNLGPTSPAKAIQEPEHVVVINTLAFEVISGKSAGEMVSKEKLKEFLRAGRYEVGTFIRQMRGDHPHEYQVIKRAGRFSLAPLEVAE